RLGETLGAGGVGRPCWIAFPASKPYASSLQTLPIADSHSRIVTPSLLINGSSNFPGLRRLRRIDTYGKLTAPAVTSGSANVAEREIVGRCHVRATFIIARLTTGPRGENGNCFAASLDARSDVARSRRLSVARTDLNRPRYKSP